MAISDHFTVDIDARVIYHDDADTTVYTVNELYSWLMDYFDESATIDNLLPITAQTPTAYTLINGWYIVEHAYNSFQYLKTGSIKSLGHDAATYSNGIRKKAYDASGAGTPFSTADIGRAITEDDSGDTGIIVDYDTSLGEDQGYVFIRTDALTDYFADTDSTYTVTDSSAAGSFTAASTTGQNMWTNIYTIGSIQANTQLYVYQNGTEITPWWSTGHIDIIIKTKESGVLIDSGYLTIFARQYTKLYDHYLANLSDNSRTPIPLATFNDTNNDSGYRQMVLTDATDEFTLGEIIEDDSDPTTQGIITSVSGTAPNVTIQYYLYNSSQADFYDGSNTFTGATSAAQATAVDPTDVGPAAIPNPVTITFGATSEDLNNTNGFRPYDVIIDVNDNTFANLYEYLKYLTRYGSDTALNGHKGEDYVAVGDIRLPYDSQTGNFDEGLTVTGGTSGATGVIVADHDAGDSGALVLRDVTGIFEDNETITDSATGSADVDLTLALDEIAPNKQSPFGTLAGSTFIGARGVWLDNVLGTEANNYELYDSTNTRQVPPATIAITISNTQTGDRVSVFQSTGAGSVDVNKSQFTSHASNNTAGANTFEIQGSIPADTPSPSGSLRVPVRDANDKITGETRYTYTGWSGSTFTGVSPALVTTYDDNDTAYVPYLDQQATGTTTSTTLTYAADRTVVTRVRISGMKPFQVDGVLDANGLPVTVVRETDTIYE